MATPLAQAFARPAYRHLFAAQIIALLGTGLLTVGLGLFAYDIAGAQGGQVLGIALTIKMLAYVFVSPVMVALTSRRNRASVLVLADLVRVAVALCLPLVSEAWQIYVLVFVLQSASATFTPTFQSILPDLLHDERTYTRALSLSRLAYNLESILSPLLAAALLSFVAYTDLFVGTALGFALSALLVLTTTVPQRAPAADTPFVHRLTRGTRAFIQVPQLRSLLGKYFTVACATAMVVVNTPILIGATFGLEQRYLPLLLAASGLGEMLIALALPRWLDTHSDHTPMALGTAAIPPLLLATALVLSFTHAAPALIVIAGLWIALGACLSLILTPSGRLIRRHVPETERPAAFAADFSLSHACFIITYLTAGLVGAHFGIPQAALALGLLAIVGTTWSMTTTPRTGQASAT